MKKLIFTGVSILIALALVTCDLQTPATQDNGGGGLGITDVVYSQDGKSLTLYLDGGVPASEARAINRDIAQFYHNLFEVVFVYGTGPTAVVARANWRYGESAAIRGVYRAGNGVSYNRVRVPGSATEGGAVLFVGRDSDKALLAIGKISHVDDEVVNLTLDGGGDPIADLPITVNTRSVTFALSALDIGVATLGTATDPDIPQYDLDTSSFLTAAKQDEVGGSGAGSEPVYTMIDAEYTDIRRASVNGNPFPLYYFPRGVASIAANYTIDNVTEDFDDNYKAGVMVASTGRVDRKPPIISVGGVTKRVLDSLVNKSTTITLGNNTGANVVFANPVEFTFSTSAVPEGSKGLFSFWFKVPVYAITTAAAPEGDSSITWNIQPGLGVEYLDDGTEIGANILIGVAMSDVDDLIIYTTGP